MGHQNGIELTQIANNLWVVAQPLRFLGLQVGTRMTVVRLGPNSSQPGQLVLISPVRLTEEDQGKLEELGKVAHLVAPNLFHYMFIEPAQQLYPQAKSWGVAGLTEKRPELKLDGLVDQPGSFGEELSYLPVQGFAALMPQGICQANETVFFHRPSRTLVLTDLAFNFDESSSLGMQFAARVLGSYRAVRPTVFEKLGTRDKATVEASMRQILQWDFDRVVLAHGGIVEQDGKAALREGYEWFLGKSLGK